MFQNTITVIAILLVIGLVVVWFVYFRSSSDGVVISVPVVGEERTVTSTNLGFAGLLAQLRIVKLDTDFFQHPIYQSLVDFGVDVIVPFEQGRRNPFAPIGAQQFFGIDPFGLPLVDVDPFGIPSIDTQNHGG